MRYRRYEMLGMRYGWNVRCSLCVICEMWDIRDVGCLECGMFKMWDVWDIPYVHDVGYSECEMSGMWDVGVCDVQDVTCSRCGM